MPLEPGEFLLEHHVVDLGFKVSGGDCGLCDLHGVLSSSETDVITGWGDASGVDWTL